MTMFKKVFKQTLQKEHQRTALLGKRVLHGACEAGNALLLPSPVTCSALQFDESHLLMIQGRKDPDAPNWWGSGPMPSVDDWRGSGGGPGRGRVSGPTAPAGPSEKQWMGRGGPPAAGPVEVPAGTPGKAPER